MDAPIAEPMSDNEALRRIVGDLDALILILAGTYETIVGDSGVAITDTETAIRDADTDAIKTVVVNTGTEKVHLYEGGNLVATLYPEETWESPGAGAFAISGKCAATKTSTVDIATYQS